jgi:hypothetical protein
MADDPQQTFYSDVDKSRHASGCVSVLISIVILAALVAGAIYFLKRFV